MLNEGVQESERGTDKETRFCASWFRVPLDKEKAGETGGVPRGAVSKPELAPDLVLHLAIVPRRGRTRLCEKDIHYE
jgi:hypothetical protein